MNRINLNEYELLPFDIAKCQEGHLVVTQDGFVFNYGAYNPNSSSRCSEVVGWVNNELRMHSRKGQYLPRNESKFDLSLAVKKPRKEIITRYLLVSKHSGYASREDAVFSLENIKTKGLCPQIFEAKIEIEVPND